jgi:hypothetical protein
MVFFLRLERQIQHCVGTVACTGRSKDRYRISEGLYYWIGCTAYYIVLRSTREYFTATEWLQNVHVRQCSALGVFEKGWLFIVPHLPWHDVSAFANQPPIYSPTSKWYRWHIPTGQCAKYSTYFTITCTSRLFTVFISLLYLSGDSKWFKGRSLGDF